MRALAAKTFAFYWGKGIADDVPALTYYLVLSLAPVALGLAALEALLLSDTQSALNVVDGLNRFLPDAVHTDIRHLVLGTRDNSPVLLAIALASMLWTTSGAIGVIERCESRILDCERHHIIVGRLRNMALGAGIVLMVLAASATRAGHRRRRRRAEHPAHAAGLAAGGGQHHRLDPRLRAALPLGAALAAELARVPAGRRACRHRNPGRALDRGPLFRRGRRLRGRAALPAAGGDGRGALHHRPGHAGGGRHRRHVRAAPPG